MKKKNIHISTVIPVYGCPEALPELYKRLINTLEKLTLSFEIIFVNDACPKDSWNIIKKISLKDKRIKGLNLSKNFGQHNAITAGLDFVQGDWIVVMDCDLQDKPEEIIKLYSTVREGYDIVFARRHNRKDSFIKKITSFLFYKMYDYFTESKTDNSIANFSIISFNVVNHLQIMREQNRAYPLFINWLGFKRTDIDIEHAPRKTGVSSYTFYKLINLAVDSIISQSNKPLLLSIKFGFFLSLSSIFYALWLIIRYYIYSVPIEGWTSVMVSLYFIGGLLFANMGMLGLYIGKIFNETKKRPLYVVSETVGINSDL